MWPWFMVGRVAHRLRMPGAPLLAFLVMVAYAVYTACLSAMGFVNHPLAFGIGGSVLWVVTSGAVAATRNAFRKALGVPGTCWSDICMSSSCATLFIAPVLWFVILLNLPHTQPSSEASNKAANDLALALTFGLLIFPIAFSFPPCWGLPSSAPNQCTPAFQLAAMESALVPPGASCAAQGAYSGMSKEAAPMLPPQRTPANGGNSWSTGIIGCTCTPRCEGDIPLCCCSLAWAWWMQARLMQRMGWTSSDDFSFSQLAGALLCLEGLPVFWNIVATLSHATGSAFQVLYCVAAVPALLFNCWLRRQVRKRYNIPGSLVCEDMLVPTFCHPCSIAQLDREITLRGEAGSSF